MKSFHQILKEELLKEATIIKLDPMSGEDRSTIANFLKKEKIKHIAGSGSQPISIQLGDGLKKSVIMSKLKDIAQFDVVR